MGAYLESKLREFKSPLIKDIRARGLFVGVEFHTGHHVDGNDLTKILKDYGLLTKATHDMTVRLTPALIITKPEIDAALEIVEKAIEDLAKLGQERMQS